MDVTQSQPKTPAERQAAHRARKQREYGKRVNLWLPEDAGRALERLARHHGVTQADLLARLLIAEDASVAAGVPYEQLGDYYGVTQ